MAETTLFGDNDQDSGGSLKANTILRARFKVLGVLGGGGQGAVYQCRDLNFPDAKRLVAIKEMHYSANDAATKAATLSTFQREANILATLAHPAIPKIYDFFDQNDRAYLVMEYINGNDLELLLNKTKELPVDKIVEWGIDLCDVLHYLHNQPEPIIFRDVKPANIMIDALAKVRLIDFGIAKIFVSGTKKHTMIGTEGYSAPEQYKGDVSPLSDIYSLAATLHHIVTRKDPRLEPPFSFNERPIQEFNDKAPSGLQTILDKALAMVPGERFQSCAQMKDALEALKYHRPVGIAGGGEGQQEEDLFGGASGGVEPRWKFKTEDEIRCSPVVHKNMAIVGSYDTNMWGINLEDGEFRWKYATQGGIASSPAIDASQDLVLFGSEDSSFYAVDASSGRIMWSELTNDRIRGTPTLAHEHVFVGSDDGRIYSFVASNGRRMWEYDMGSPVRSKPYVTDSTIIVGSDAGDLTALDLSGSRKWSIRIKRGVNAAPFVDEIEDICYVGGFDGYMHALDASNGFSMWRFRTNGPIVSSAVMEGTLLYFGSADGNFYAINAENSKEKWRFTIEKPIVASPVLHEGRVYIGGTDGIFYCLDAKTGDEIWRFATEDAITAAPYIAESLILVASMDHTLYALPLVTV